MNYRAVLFDLDGTLLDTIEDLADSLNEVLKQSGLPIHDLETFKYFIGSGVHQLVSDVLPENYRDYTTVEKYAGLMRDEYSRRWNRKTRPYEGIPELLNELDGRNMKIAVLSNKADDFTKIMISYFFPRQKFEAVFGERRSVPKKPDPAAAFEIAAMTDIQPHDFLYLGDSGIDMETANAAGMYAIGVLWGYRGADELAKSGAKTLIRHPLELLNLPCFI